MNIIMNFVKRFLVGGGTKDRVEASRRVGALLLPVLDLALASLSYFLGMSVGKLMQRLCRVMQNPGTIAIKGLNVIFLNRLADPLGMELLEL